MAREFRVKRIYAEPSEQDGVRILVDRLWPRGVSKVAARINFWPKQLTPSNELRKWFHEETTRYEEFARKYFIELEEQHDEISEFLQSLDEPVLTLVTATKDPNHGHVAVLKKFLERFSMEN